MAIGNGSYFGTAGLLIKKNAGQTPSGNASYYGTAGLPAEPKPMVRSKINSTLAQAMQNKGLIK